MNDLADFPWELHPLAREYARMSPAHRESSARVFGCSTEALLKAKVARIDLANGYGLSIIIGPMFYSDGVSTYEVMVVPPDGSMSEPHGHLTADEVLTLMRETTTKP